MPARSESFAHRARELMLAAGAREFTIQEIAEGLDLVSDAEKRPVYRVFQDFIKASEIKKVRPGVYLYIKKKKAPEKQEVMWRLLRSRKVVSVDDLEELSGANRCYVRQWLCRLRKREVVTRLKNGKFRLMSDVVDMPKNDEKSAYLRDLRTRRKRALEKLDAASAAIADAREAVEGLENG